MSWRDLAQQFKDMLGDRNQADQLKARSSVLTPEQYAQFASKSLTPARQAMPPADLDVQAQEILDGIDTALVETKAFLTNMTNILDAPAWTNASLSVDDANSHDNAGSGWLANRGPIRALLNQTDNLFPLYESNMNGARELLQLRHDMILRSAIAETDLINRITPQAVRDALNGLDALNQAADFRRDDLVTAETSCYARAPNAVTRHVWAAQLLKYYYSTIHDMARVCDMIQQIHTAVDDEATGVREALVFRTRVRDLLLKAITMEELWFINGGSNVHADPRVRTTLNAGDPNFTAKVNTVTTAHNNEMDAIIAGPHHCSNVDLTAAGNAYNPPL